jgi:hypothetical protein
MMREVNPFAPSEALSGEIFPKGRPVVHLFLIISLTDSGISVNYPRFFEEMADLSLAVSQAGRLF